MPVLTRAARKALPASDFALGKDHYPIPDPSHARNALARVSAYGTPSQQTEVRAAVHRKFPSIGQRKTVKLRKRAG
jgi:hypothetical protein